jgi:hypothetical protein
MLSGRFAYVCLVTSRQRLSLTHNLCGATFRLARPYPGSTGPVQHSLYPPVHLPLQQQQTPARHLATSAGMDDDVRVSLRRLLPTVDMEKTTERQVGRLLPCCAGSCSASAPIEGTVGTALPVCPLLFRVLDDWY